MGKFLYVTCEDRSFKITGAGVQEVEALNSCHEEADGRLLLHAAHAEGYKAIIIVSEDTDVFILSLAFCQDIQACIYQKCGKQTRTRLIDISKIASAVGNDLCKALIGLHAFTGCDSVSAFAGRGKLNALKIMKAKPEIADAFLKLGQLWSLSDDLLNKLEKFTCLLYTSTPNTFNVNSLRYNLFCTKNGKVESHQLPPCLPKHCLRANYQAGI